MDRWTIPIQTQSIDWSQRLLTLLNSSYSYEECVLFLILKRSQREPEKTATRERQTKLLGDSFQNVVIRGCFEPLLNKSVARLLLICVSGIFFFTLFISFCSIPYGSQSHAVPRQVLSQCVWFNKREQLLPKRLCSSYINVKRKGIVRARIWLGAHFGI